MARPRAVGVRLPACLRPERLVELGVEAERAGLDLVRVEDGPVDSFAVLGALAARTGRVALHAHGASWTRTPVTTALSAATLNALSLGRFRLGLGAIPTGRSEAWHGVESDSADDRLRDFVGALRAAWRSRRGHPVDHVGPFYVVTGYERPGEPPHGPLAIDLWCTRPRMLDLACAVADGVVVGPGISSDELRAEWLPVVEDALARAGRARSDVDVGLAVAVSGGGSVAQLECELGRYEGLVDWLEALPPAGASAHETEAGTLRVIEALAAASPRGPRAAPR